MSAPYAVAQQNGNAAPSGSDFDVPIRSSGARYTEVTPNSVLPTTPAASTAPIITTPQVVLPATRSQTTIEQTVTTRSGNTQTTTTVTETQAPSLRPAVVTTSTSAKPIKYKRQHSRSDWHTARRMAKYHWLDKAAEADPSLVEAICSHYTAACILAKHPRLGAVAQFDHYTCRRLTKWKSVARILAKNGECQKVVLLDPEGMYRALKRDKRLAKILSTNPMFDQMLVDNPDLGRMMATLM